MAVKKLITLNSGLYFVTITCTRWLQLFEEVMAYDLIYGWFDYLKTKGNSVTGFVIMPNHLHALLFFNQENSKSINTIIGNGKRFLAYAIIKRLQEAKKLETLDLLKSFVNPSDWKKGKLHDVFRPSFDAKRCWTEEFYLQKLHYIHQNPCRGVWNLAEKPELYEHSSAKYYISVLPCRYPITHVSELVKLI